MIELLENIIPYISGLNTLPWILVGFVVTILIAKITGRDKIDKIMKKIGLILLYFFIPLLLFRIFLDLFEPSQVTFVVVVFLVIFLMYIIAYIYSKYLMRRNKINEEKQSLFFKTILTNQGRSSAFIGSAMMAYWPVAAGIMIAIVGIALFAIIPYFLSHMHKQDTKKSKDKEGNPLPWYLRLYPWYLIAFVIIAVTLNLQTDITTATFGDFGSVVKFYTAITIPAALYYVGASIHPSDIKITEIKKLFGVNKTKKNGDHWDWVRHMFILTVVLTPIVILLIFAPLYFLDIIDKSWFAVITINSILPITSTNMFLIPYGIDKKSTAHVITWTTLICVPLVIIVIAIFGSYL